jgi:hypothetical protein
VQWCSTSEENKKKGKADGMLGAEERKGEREKNRIL